MSTRHGDFNYDAHGHGYARQRRTDPQIERLVHAALGPARTVLNVGAGAGSYEPVDRHVTAVEPAAVMRAQRPLSRVPAVIGHAEALPFDDWSFDASMALVTVHQWADHVQGLSELRRVTRGPILVLTFDIDALDRFWLAEYLPELMAAERRRFPAIETLRTLLGKDVDVLIPPIPRGCLDGFLEAYYARPEAFLDPAVRQAQSAWGFVAPDIAERGVQRLREDLSSGVWDERYGHWRTLPAFEGSLRLLVGREKE